jgi:hypothetical protein
MLDSTLKAYGQFLDQITAPRGKISKEAQRRKELAKRIYSIAADLSLEGRQGEANVLYEVVEALGGR